MTFHITSADVKMVLAHQYTQEDYSRDVGIHQTIYNLVNNHESYDAAFWKTALVLETVARHAKSNFDPIDLGLLLTHLKGG